MEIWQAIFLGIVQGATEFLPVSSSGHLVLVPWLLGWEAPGLAFDAVLHLGTMAAVLVYFWRDWVRLLRGGWQVVRRRSFDHADGRVLAMVVVASIPAGIVGFLFEDFFESVFNTPVTAALFLLVTAGLLVAAERLGDPARVLGGLTWTDALVVGLAQTLAIFPGVSRSGSTIAAGLWRGLRREEAARFSFLIGTPIIFAAGVKQIYDAAAGGQLAAISNTFFAGVVAAAVVGYLCIWWLLNFLRRQRLFVFAGYCTALSIVCLVVALTRG
ncbi:MAG: undecaprenyl-diphosphatase UppP [Anaerolineae bacterium]|nr:undecaprenyl-diphosphatase UppP [Anaerolineae bacterium]